jgi:flagellar basal-body rod protein FlgF
MLRGLYTAASGMISHMLETDTLANNLANVSTTGFKKSSVSFQSFPEMMIHKIQAGGIDKTLGNLSTGLKVQGTHINFQSGMVRQTGNPLDVAMEGDGFFTLKLGNGQEAYTRDGSFTINGRGELCTHDGRTVMGSQGTIPIPPTGEIVINNTGDIYVNNTLVDRLKITRFQNPDSLEKLGNTTYVATPASTIATAPGDKPTRIQQGALEGSNTNAITELVRTLEGMRLYEALQKNITTHNQLLGKAVNDIAAPR